MAYEPRKAAQLIAYLILKSGFKSLSVLKAVKLVYLVDRESIRRYGFPVLDEPRVSMPHGPVNSWTLNFINGYVDDQGTGWADFVTDRENHMISLARPDIVQEDFDELSEADEQCADVVWARFGAMDRWSLRDWTHETSNVPEWKNPGLGSAEISLLSILRAVGVENAEEFDATAQAFTAIDKAFEAARMN